MSEDVAADAKAALAALTAIGMPNISTLERFQELTIRLMGMLPDLVAEVERLREGLTSIENFARIQALSDHVRSGPGRFSYEGAERYWLDLLASIERVQVTE